MNHHQLFILVLVPCAIWIAVWVYLWSLDSKVNRLARDLAQLQQRDEEGD